MKCKKCPHLVKHGQVSDTGDIEFKSMCGLAMKRQVFEVYGDPNKRPGRKGTKTYVKLKGTGGKGSMVGSTIAGTKTDPKTGKTMKRTLADGSKVVVEGSVQKFKKKGGAMLKSSGEKPTLLYIV